MRNRRTNGREVLALAAILGIIGVVVFSLGFVAVAEPPAPELTSEVVHVTQLTDMGKSIVVRVDYSDGLTCVFTYYGQDCEWKK